MQKPHAVSKSETRDPKKQARDRVQEDVVRITAEPRLPPISKDWTFYPPEFVLNGVVKSTAYIAYTDHGRSDKTSSLRVTSETFSATFDFGSLIRGGKLVANIKAPWRNTKSGNTGTLDFEWDVVILGDNPRKAEIRGKLGSVPLQVIAYLESRFRQFIDKGNDVGKPLWGPGSGTGGGFGVMQIDNPAPKAQEIWDWKGNVNAGIRLFKNKEKEVKTHFKNEYKKYPKAPKLSTEQLKQSVYAYYNGGTSAYYWYWNRKTAKWEVGGLTKYANAATAVEAAVLAGNPPQDWND